MVTWANVLANIDDMWGAQLKALQQGKPAPYAYLYGGDGRKATAAYVRSLVKQYGPAHYNALFERTGKTVEDLIAHVKGKNVFDCSQVVLYVTEHDTDMTSTGLINQCKVQMSPKDGLAGSLLWKPGHVGIDLGGGRVFDMPGEFEDLRETKMYEAQWQKSGQLPWVNYAGSSNM